MFTPKIPFNLLKLDEKAKEIKYNEGENSIDLIPIYFSNAEGFKYERHMLKPNEEIIAELGWAIQSPFNGYYFQIISDFINNSIVIMKLEYKDLDPKLYDEKIFSDFKEIIIKIKNYTDNIELNTNKPLVQVKLACDPKAEFFENTKEDIIRKEVFKNIY